MSYQTAITIKEIIDNIKEQHYVLPSIQREFVWKTDQIEKLFDSLMRDYPIGTFLFWKVNKGNIKDFQFYEFLKKYHEKDHRHNQKAVLSDNQDIIAILDGQQRLTSLYLALVGSYTFKTPYMARKNPNAYPERKLYLNLLKPSDEDELEVEYDFRFLTKEAVTAPDKRFHWFECSRILWFADKNEIYDYLDDENLSDPSIHEREMVKFARNTLNRFYDVIHEKGTISFYQEEGEELDKVLQIFIRINSGGTKLSYSDLLLSIATAQWGELDAREVIYKFVDEINNIGNKFSFEKDHVLKNCLVLADFTDVKFKVDNFNKENMRTIEEAWERTSSALHAAIELIAKFGYTGENLTAHNAIIPIAYFIYKNEYANQILHHDSREDDRKAIKKWLARVLLKGTFGGQPDSIYPAMRNLINDNLGRFPLEETITFYRGRGKSISFNSDEIDNLLELEYGKPKTYCALTLLYPALNHSFKYDQDHIHPKSKFDKRAMKTEGLSEEQIEQFKAKMNNIANLQFLEATGNSEKLNKPFKEWLNQKYSNENEKNTFLNQHHISSEQSLEFEDFLDFVDARSKTLKAEFAQILGVTAEENDDTEQQLDS